MVALARPTRRGNVVDHDVGHRGARSRHPHGRITGLKGAFSVPWAEPLREDMMTAFWEAIQRPGGAIGRGPRRWYVEVHPQQISGFVDLATHPWVVAVSTHVLGPDYEIVEIGFDIPFQGAKYQPCLPPRATRDAAPLGTSATPCWSVSARTARSRKGGSVGWT